MGYFLLRLQYDLVNRNTQDVIDYIEMFYNSHRLHSYLGYQSPNAYEAAALLKAA